MTVSILRLGRTARFRAISTLAILLLGAAWAHGDEETSLQRYRLDNGLRVWHRERTDADSVGICLSIGVGSRDESEQNNGISHFLEHMLFAGSEKYDRTQLMEMIRQRGGIQNGQTTQERTVYFAYIAQEHFELAMDWLTQVVFHPTFPADWVERERNIVIEEKGGTEGWLRHGLQAMGVEPNLELAVRKRIFPDSPLAFATIGEDKALKTITRDDLMAYYRANYTPSNAVLIVVGNVSPERVKKACDEYLAAVPTGKKRQSCSTPALPTEPPKPVTMRAPGYTRQCTLMMSVRTCGAADPDRYPLEVLASLVQQNLMREARLSEGLAYRIDADNDFLSDAGCFTVTTYAKRKNLERLQELLDKEMETIRAGKADAASLDSAKEFLCGMQALSSETNANRMIALESLAWRYADDAPLPVYKEKIKAVTSEDLQRVLEKYFVPQRTCMGTHVPIL